MTPPSGAALLRTLTRFLSTIDVRVAVLIVSSVGSLILLRTENSPATGISGTRLFPRAWEGALETVPRNRRRAYSAGRSCRS